MEITKEFAQELVNYLQQKPYAEVYILIAKLQEAANKEKPDAEETKEATNTPKQDAKDKKRS